MEFPKYLGIVILAILVVAMSAMAAQPWSVPSNCVVLNKTLVSSGNKPSTQTFTVVPHIYAYGIPVGGNAMLSIQPPPSTSSTAPYIFALADISPTDSNATAKLEITWDKYVYDVYIYTLNCTISVNKTEIRQVTIAENITSVDTGRHTWNKSGNLADVIKSLSSWSVPVPIPYSNLPADYYVPAGGLGVRVNFELNFTRPTMVSGLKAGVNNTGKYGVSVPIINDTIDLVVGDRANMSRVPNPFISRSSDGRMSISVDDREYNVLGQWKYNDYIPSDVHFWGAIVPRDWDYIITLDVAKGVPAVQTFEEQLILSEEGNTYTIYEWPSNVSSLNCSTLKFLNSKIGSYTFSSYDVSVANSFGTSLISVAITTILANKSHRFLPGYGWYKVGEIPFCNTSTTKWYIVFAHYIDTLSVQWKLRVLDVNFDGPPIYVVQPAGGVTDIKVYLWGESPIGTFVPYGITATTGVVKLYSDEFYRMTERCMPEECSRLAQEDKYVIGTTSHKLYPDPKNIAYVYGATIAGTLWLYGPYRNPYNWLAWPPVLKGNTSMPIEMGYPGKSIYQINVTDYYNGDLTPLLNAKLYIWNWPALNPDPSEIVGFANYLNRGSHQQYNAWTGVIEPEPWLYIWRTFGHDNMFVGTFIVENGTYKRHPEYIDFYGNESHDVAVGSWANPPDPITNIPGFRFDLIAYYWNPSMYKACYLKKEGNLTITYGVRCTDELSYTLKYPVDIWAPAPPRPPVNDTTDTIIKKINGTNTNSTNVNTNNTRIDNNVIGGSSVPTPIYTRIRSGGGGGGGSPGGFLWGLLPLTTCKSLACVNPDAAYWTGGFTGSMALPDMPFALAVKWLGSSSVTTTIYVYASWAKYVSASMPQGGGLVKLGTFTLEPNTWYLIVPGSAQPLPKPNPCGYTPVPPGWLIAPNEAGVFGTVLFVTPQGNARDFYYTTKAVLSYTVSTMPAPNIIQPTVLFDSTVLMQSYKPVLSTPVDQFFPQPNAPMSWWPFKASEAPYGYWTATCKGGYSGYTGNLAPYQRVDISYQPGSAQLISANVVHASVSPIVEGYFKGGEGLYVTIRPNITGPLPPSAIKGYYLYFQRNGTWVLSGELRAGAYTCNFSPMKSVMDKMMKYVGFIGMIRSTFNTTIINRMCRYTPTNDGTVTIYMPASQAWDPATMLPIWPWDSAMVVPNVRYSGSIVGSGTIVAPSVSSAKLFNYWNVS